MDLIRKEPLKDGNYYYLYLRNNIYACKDVDGKLLDNTFSGIMALPISRNNRIIISTCASIIGERRDGKMYDIISGDYISEYYVNDLSFYDYAPCNREVVAYFLSCMKKGDIRRYMEALRDVRKCSIEEYNAGSTIFTK